jgi:hypothetical protein
LGDETELVKSLAELDSHMEQVNTWYQLLKGTQA